MAVLLRNVSYGNVVYALCAEIDKNLCCELTPQFIQSRSLLHSYLVSFYLCNSHACPEILVFEHMRSHTKFPGRR